MVEAFQNEEMQNVLGSIMTDIESAVPSIKSAFADFADVITNDVKPAYEGFKSGLQWTVDNKELVIAAIAGVAGGFATLKGITLVKQHWIYIKLVLLRVHLLRTALMLL